MRGYRVGPSWSGVSCSPAPRWNAGPPLCSYIVSTGIVGMQKIPGACWPTSSQSVSSRFSKKHLLKISLNWVKQNKNNMGSNRKRQQDDDFWLPCVPLYALLYAHVDMHTYTERKEKLQHMTCHSWNICVCNNLNSDCCFVQVGLIV